ncbi:glycosyltransferase family 4 protein [Rhizosaccharibacter radicis]|uniref:Glycosyltransferase family 4 protein n=1 Tax=Rhizosaccharibacter radicis TaxID=2782605 RepID=A0ABT1VW72_9PROT|nr:glycosyltransferase family 4 protein [Acetobacteraceae bacterium KSS12]
MSVPRDGSKPVPSIWFDVEDLFEHVRHNPRPSGIQRLALEIMRGMVSDPAMRHRVGFVRHAPDGRDLLVVSWAEVDRLFGSAAPVAVAAAMPAAPSGSVGPGVTNGGAPARRGRLDRLLGVVPARVRRPALLFAVMQTQAAAALSGIAVSIVRQEARRGMNGLGRGVRAVRRSGAAGDPASDGATARPAGEAPRRLSDVAVAGDVLTVLGSPWNALDYAALVSRARGLHGLRFAVLMHDAIPVLRPEWCDRGINRIFRHWYGSVLPLADFVFANSRATASDVEGWCGRAGIPLPGAVRPVPVGSGFGAPAGGDTVAATPRAIGSESPRRPFVLFVSTIEARKNHLLLFRVWRRLMEELPASDVPDLVFVGRAGWLVADLMDQIRNSRFLDGRLRLMQDVDDATLRGLYRSCLFTVFPSFYEGWGLPVTESLAFGTPCIASRATSIPEAGGSLARYLDPDSVGDATRVIRDAITDRQGLADWQERIQREFRPVPWSAAGRAMLDAVDAAS